MTLKRVGGKLNTIRTNFKNAGDTNKRIVGRRAVLTFYELCEKLWSGSPAVTSIKNSTNQSTESTENNDSKNIESGSNFEESNYSDEATGRRSKTRKLLNKQKSEKLSSKAGAAMLQRRFKFQNKNDWKYGSFKRKFQRVYF